MATQFYRTLDQIADERATRNQLINDKLARYEQATVAEDYDTELARLKTNMGSLGINQQRLADEFNGRPTDKHSRQQFIREHNIKHGSPRWFRVMYAQPHLTGEDPYGE